MLKTKRGWLVIGFPVFGLIIFIAQLFLFPTLIKTAVAATPVPDIATESELIIAQAEWEVSAHSDTYDMGAGANTTCARCKSPLNWDPNQDLAQEQALDCSSCKRVQGAPRPELESGISVELSAWKNISCEVCHIPTGESYYTSIAFWDNSTGQYQEVESSNELCGHCHEGRHGFEVIKEQEISLVHLGMSCVDCHGSHGKISACEDCHDPFSGEDAYEHMRHLQVNCSACHDAGNLNIWYDENLNSKHFGEYITRRFAHTLTSWPSHNLQLEVECERCHHPEGRYLSVIAPNVSCEVCHEEGAAIFWCERFPRDLDPNE